MIIRRMTTEDYAPLYELLSDPRVMKYIEPPYSMEKTEQFLSRAGLSDPPLVYAVDEDDSFIGYVIYHDYDKHSVEIGWVLYPNYWGKGYACKLTEMMIEKAFSSDKEVVIECVPEQTATKHLAIKFGFDCVGKNGDLEVFKLRK
jgi:RimJ/RimL family protein N-acetyltransferase